jgi:hypothetical protein
MKTAEIYLGYFKRGDDLGYHLQHADNLLEALERHAEQMQDVAGHLRAIRKELGDWRNLSAVDIEADTHVIQISGPDELIDHLVAKELAQVDPDNELEDCSDDDN